MTGTAGVLVALGVGLLASGLPQTREASLPPSTLPMRLTGVIVGAAKSECVIRCTAAPERWGIFHTGDRVCDLGEIQEIRRDRIVIKNLLTTRSELLTVSVTNAPASTHPSPPVSTSAAAASPDAVAVDVPKASVDHYLANLPELLSSALATPRYRDTDSGQRAIDGFEISQIRPGGAVEQLGLRNGDVILEVDGQPLDGMPTVMRLLGQLQTMPQTKLTVLRDGQRMTFVFNTK